MRCSANWTRTWSPRPSSRAASSSNAEHPRLRRRGRERLSQQLALALEERLGHIGFRHDAVEAVKGPRDDLDLTLNTGGLESLGIRQVLVVKQIQRADSEPRLRQSAQVFAARGHRDRRIRPTEVSRP